MFNCADFDDDDAAVTSPTPKGPPSGGFAAVAPQRSPQQQQNRGLRRPRSESERAGSTGTAAAAVTEELPLHQPSDPGFRPLTLPLSGGAASIVDVAGATWAASECHCLRCEVVRVGRAAWRTRELLRAARQQLRAGPGEADNASGAAAAAEAGRRERKRQPRSEAQREVEGRSSSQLSPSESQAGYATMAPSPNGPSPNGGIAPPPATLLLDLDNYGFPQLKSAAPIALQRLIAEGRIIVWGFYGGGFTRFFKTDAREYVDGIRVASAAGAVGRCVLAAQRWEEKTSRLPPKKQQQQQSQQRDRKRDASGSNSSSATSVRTGPSCWAVLKAAGALVLSPCGAQSQAADEVILDAVWLAAPDHTLVVATADRGLQEDVRTAARRADPASSVHVVSTHGKPDAEAFWDAVAATLLPMPAASVLPAPVPQSD